MKLVSNSPSQLHILSCKVASSTTPSHLSNYSIAYGHGYYTRIVASLSISNIVLLMLISSFSCSMQGTIFMEITYIFHA